MHYREILPQESLGDRVASFWEFAAYPNLEPGYIHTIPVDGCVSVACMIGNPHFRGCVIVGPRPTSLQVPIWPGAKFWGVRLLPGASRSVIGIDGAGLSEVHQPLATLLPELEATLRPAFESAESFEQVPGILTKTLVEFGRDLPQPEEAVMQGIYRIVQDRGLSRTSDVAEAAGWSERQFQRIFRKEVGLTPKQFARICRLRAAAIDAVDGQRDSWGSIAAERGYTDQAHMTREFSALFGMSPTQFERHCIEKIEHVEIRRDL